MDFLDPEKERRSRTKLLMGYGLMALAIGIATLVLLYQAYGFNVDRQGDVTQNGLVFVSSQPSGANIYLNGSLYKSNTNTRVTIPAGRYNVKITSDGYRDWQRSVFVAGGDVQHFDYPFLFPKTLATTSLTDLDADPTVATQSPDKRWLLLGQPTASGVFTEYDFKSPDKPVATQVPLPAGSFTSTDGTQTWAVVEWAADNRHVLLQHTFVSGTVTNREYVLLNRDTPADSVNLTNTLSLNQTETLNLFNNRTDQFYLYSAADQTLMRVNGSDGSVVSKLERILAFKTYADNKILYVTDQSPTGKATPSLVSAVLQDGQQTITLRTLPAGDPSSFVLNLAQYSDDWYVAVASTNDTAAYIYKNPQSQSTGADIYPAPWRRVPLKGVNFLSFSSSAQFLLAESGQDFAVYDFENVAQYHFHVTQPIDPPQTHAVWMDGAHLTFVSGGKLEAFDYDYQNQQSLVVANPAFAPFFAPDFSYLYTLRPVTGDAKSALTSTSLVIKK